MIPAAAAAAAFAEAGLQPPGSVAAAPSPARPPGRRRLAAALAVVAVVAVVAGLLVRRGTGDDQQVGSGATTTRATADGEPSITEDPVDHDGLSATRSYGFEQEGGTDLVGSQVVLANTTSETTRRIWFEAVPKDLAASVDDVRFLREPSGVLDEDPVVYWVVTLDPGAEATLGWSTPLPDGSSPDEATLAKVAAMHRSALDASADLIATATAALERLTGATATEPGGSEPGEGGGGQGEGTTVAEGTVTTTDGAGGTGGSDPTVVDQPTTTSGGKVTVTAAVTTTTAAPLAKPGAVTGVTVRSPAFVGGTNKSVRVSISWGAPTSGGGSITGYKVRHQQLWSGSCSSGSQAWVEASTGTARSTTQSADTQCGSSWVVWQVAAVNASGVGPYTTATGVMPDVIGAQNAYHLVRSVGGRAGGLAERDCGVAAYAACYTSVSAGASLSPGTSVGISQQTSG